MILWVFIEFFGVKIVITDIYRYFTDIFTEIIAQARVLHSRNFLVENQYFLIFRWKIDDFIDFSSDRFFLYFFFSLPTKNRFFDDISAEKNDFWFPDHNRLY